MNYRAKVTIDEKGVKRYVNTDKDSFVIGRAPNVDVPIPDEMISRQQIKVTIEDESIWIEDLGSSNGTFVDQKKIPIREKIQVRKGQTLNLGSKTGPQVQIEALAQTGIMTNPLAAEPPAHQEILREEPVRRVANGSESLPPRRPPPVREKLTLVNPVVKAKVAEKKTEVERSVFEQIKHLMNMEAEEIQQMALEEARQIKNRASEEALRVIEDAKDKAAQKLRETENSIHQKTVAFQELEEEAVINLERLKDEHYEIATEVETLKRTEQEQHKILTDLKREIEAEEYKIQREREQINFEKNELEEAKKKIEAEYRDLELEERKIKARIEVDTLEAKSKIAQIYAAAEKAQALKDTLEPEVQALKLQKDEIDLKIHDIDKERRRLEYDLEKINKELEMARYNLEIVRKDQEVTKKEIDQARQGLVQFEQDLNKRDKDTQYLLERTQRESEETLYQAKTEARKLVEEAEAELKKIIARQEKVKSEIERVKEESSRRVAAAQEETQKILAKTNAEAAEIKEKAQKEVRELKKTADDLYIEKQVEARSIVDSAQKQSAATLEKANLESSQILEKASQESSKILEAANQESAKVLDGANKESAKIIESAKRYSETKKKESDTMIEQLKVELKNRQKESMIAFAATEDKRLAIEEQVANLEKDYEKRLAEMNERADGIIRSAEQEASELRGKMEAAIEAEFQQRKAENEALRLDTETQRQKLAEKLDAEFKEAKQKQQATLAELRQIEMVNIKELRRKAEEEIQNSRAEKAKTLSTNIYAMIAGELFKAKNKVIDDNFIEPFSKEIKEMVTDIILDRPGAQSDKLQQVLKKSIDSRGKEQRYWQKMGIIGGSIVAVILLVTIFPSIITGPKDAIVTAFTEKDTSGADAFVKMKVEEARARMTFAPPTTPEFKPSYVDNVVYTTDYEAKRQAKAFQDKWILELNDYFINQLDVKDTTIIKFVSLESTLIKDLTKLKNQVDPQNPEPKLEEMRAREKEFKEKLGTIFDDHGKVSRFYEYSEKFWNEYHNPRRIGQ